MNRARNFQSLFRFLVAMAIAIAPFHPRLAFAASELPPPTGADFARLQKEVSEQRQLIIQMMQVEQQRYDMLLRLLQSGGQVAPSALPPPPQPPAASSGGAAPATTAAATKAPSERVGGSGVVTGHVQVRSGSLKDAYVYVDMAKGSGGRGHTLEIKQKDKQFSPQVAVVQKGTSVSFPNLDAVFHSVFSTSGRNSFDLGSYRSGDPARSATLTTPGVVEVFCNIHAKMNAAILVVPGPLYTKVAPDGSFRLENVPVGARRIVAWTPNAKPVQQKVDVTLGSTQVTFTIDLEGTKAHMNKLGQPYGSYKE
jgi:plastocyanin